QQGRHHFEHRLALVAGDLAEAVELLGRAGGGEAPADCRRATVDRDFSGEPDERRSLETLARQAPELLDRPEAYRGRLLALADLYCRGYAIPSLHPTPPRRVSLPGYPFARERCWIDEQPAPAPTRTEATANR